MSAASWLEPYRIVWESRSGAGSFRAVAGQCARYLKPLEDAHGAQAVAAAFAKYLEADPVRYRSVARFAANYAEYAGLLPGPQMSDDEIARSIKARLKPGPQFPHEFDYSKATADERRVWAARGGPAGIWNT